MTKDEKINICSKELRELSELFEGVKTLPQIPVAIIKLMQEKAQYLADQIHHLNDEQSLMQPQTHTLEPIVVKVEPVQEEVKEVEKIEKVQEVKTEDPVIKPESGVVAVEPEVEKQSEPQPIFEALERTHSKEAVVTAPREDFRCLMTLNDRFEFQRQLFHGDVGMLNYTIVDINNCQDIHQAQQYICDRFQWDAEDKTVILFNDLLVRHFQK